MVKKEIIDDKEVFRCGSCGLSYEGEDLAHKCEKWCIEKGNCNNEITVQSIERKKYQSS